jgi:protein-disulfide isomerase/uncharacterized coiled-coil protein SlyX
MRGAEMRQLMKGALQWAGVFGFVGLVVFGISGAADRYATLEGRLAQLESQNQAIATQLTNLRNDVSGVQQSIARLNDRLTLLEGKVAKLDDAPKKPTEYPFPVPEGLKGEEDLAAVFVRPDAPVKGSSGARVVIVEFSDFQCPYCGRFFRDTLPQIQMDYINKGLARMYYLHLPLSQLHPQAMAASIASECAAKRGKFWEMHDLLFQNQTMLSNEDLKRYLGMVGMDGSEYEACANDTQIVRKIQGDMAIARDLGINGTPSFIIGLALPDGRIVGKRLVGAQPYTIFKSTIERVLAAAKG